MKQTKANKNNNKKKKIEILELKIYEAKNSLVRLKANGDNRKSMKLSNLKDSNYLL